jgi:hypothetical protein
MTPSGAIKAQHFLASIFLTKSETNATYSSCKNLSRSSADGRENEELWLFETLAHNCRASRNYGVNFFI